jgi:hypothetical protein
MDNLELTILSNELNELLGNSAKGYYFEGCVFTKESNHCGFAYDESGMDYLDSCGVSMIGKGYLDKAELYENMLSIYKCY